MRGDTGELDTLRGMVIYEREKQVMGRKEGREGGENCCVLYKELFHFTKRKGHLNLKKIK